MTLYYGKKELFENAIQSLYVFNCKFRCKVVIPEIFIPPASSLEPEQLNTSYRPNFCIILHYIGWFVTKGNSRLRTTAFSFTLAVFLVGQPQLQCIPGFRQWKKVLRLWNLDNNVNLTPERRRRMHGNVFKEKNLRSLISDISIQL